MTQTIDEIAAGAILRRKLFSIKKQSRATFIKTYRENPVAFAHDCLYWSEKNEGLTQYQQEILDGLWKHGRLSVRGPHGLGKTAIAAIAIHHFDMVMDGEEDWKLPTTAGSWKQLTHFLWPEIRKWGRAIRWDRVGRAPYNMSTELLKLNIKGKTGEAFAVASTQPELIEGAHADCMFFVYDESKAIMDAVFDASEGAFSGAVAGSGRLALALSISTPGDVYGRFYEIQMNGTPIAQVGNTAWTPPKKGYADWITRHVTLQETIEAQRNSRAWADARRDQWGATSQVYLNRVEGEFAPNDADGVIPLAWVQLAVDRWRENGTVIHEGYRAKENDDPEEVMILTPPLEAVGVDVAEGGEDDSVIARRHGNWIGELEYRHHEDPMMITGRVVVLVASTRKKKSDRPKIVVDVVGPGAGVVARLKEQRHRVLPYNASHAARGKDMTGELEFLNTRSRSWWRMRELLDPTSGHLVALPNDPRLIGELTTPRYRVNSSGKIQIESKDEIRKRLAAIEDGGNRQNQSTTRMGRSTDAADAVIMAFDDGEAGTSWAGLSVISKKKASRWTA